MTPADFLDTVADAHNAGRDVGRIEAIRDASRLLLRLGDVARDERTRLALEHARRRVERLTSEALEDLEPADSIVAVVRADRADRARRRKGGAR